MGNKSTIHASENENTGSMLQSLKKKLLGSEEAQPVSAAGDSSSQSLSSLQTDSIRKSAGDFASSSATSSTASLTPFVPQEDPRTIVSSIPSFPGTWNEVHKVKELLPMPFDGVRATFNKGLSHHFQVSHNFTLGTMQPSGYKFGATYAGAKQLSQTETFPILTGEIDPSGNLTAQCLHAFSKYTRSRLIAQHQGGRFAAIELGTDYRGPKTTLSVTAANPDLLNQTGIYIGHLLYAVKPNLAIGCEALLQRALNPALGQVATQFSGSLVAKYNAEKWSAAAQISPLEMGIHASYYHKLAKNQAIGVELEGRGAAGECSTTLAYCFDVPGAECTMKASVDSSMNIATTIEKKLTPLPMTITLSCQGNQKKAQYLAGIGISTG